MKTACASCGAIQRTGASFCKKCGRRLLDADSDDEEVVADAAPRSVRTSFRLLWLALGAYFVLLVANLGSFLGKIGLPELRGLDAALLVAALVALEIASRKGPVPGVLAFFALPRLSLRLLGEIAIVVLAALGAAALLGLVAPMLDKDFMQLYRAQGQSLHAAIFDLCLMAPLLEETVFRGIVLGALLPLLGVRGALLASSLMFAALHLTPLTFVHHTLLGYICGHARLQTRSMLFPVCIHAGYNAVVVLFSW